MGKQGKEQPTLPLFEAIARAFRLPGTLQSFEPFGSGHINGTYRLTFRDGAVERQYIAQTVNAFVFKKPYEVMENELVVTGHLKKKGIPTLKIHENEADRSALFMHDGEYWRVADALPGVTYETADDPEILKNSGRAFGAFVNALSDLDADLLHETIPAFHDTVRRFEALSEAEKADVSGRTALVREELRLFRERAKKACLAAEAAREGTLPVRVTHNDTKFNNVIMDPETREAIAVIDLDTVMPGTILFDFGDAIRYLSNTAAEDETDLLKVRFDLARFKLFSEGFLSEVRDALTEEERKLMLYAPFDATMECGVRFLTDYLSGDVYFKTGYPEHNLVRAKNQLALAMDMERNEAKMKTILEEILG